MTFARVWVLLLMLVPLAWAVWEWRRSQRRVGLVLKALALAAILLALAEPRLGVWETKMAVAVLVDTSASVSDDDLEVASRIATEIETVRGRHWVQVIPFAKGVRAANAVERSAEWALRQTAGADGRGTDIEAAIGEAIASIPAGLVPRVVLISDGRENRGTFARAAWQARELGVPVDTYALSGRPEPLLKVESVSVPARAFTGERFPVDIVVRSPEAADGRVEVSAEGKLLGSSPVRLSEGANSLRVYASLNSAGAFDLSGLIRAGDLGEARFAQAVRLDRPRLLYVSQDPPGSEEHLIGALRPAGFDVQLESELPTERLSGYQVLALNNWDLRGIPEGDKERIEEYVQQGGGLLVIGGENNVYLDEEEQPEDALERALPATLAPPRSPEGTCVVLIVDKSSSMEGRKMQLARQAAAGVIENLRPVDRIGVLIFDNSHRWAVPIRSARDRSLIQRMVAGIMPDGGTQIAPALSEGYRRILPIRATFKHIVLLTDGISEEGDSMRVAREAGEREVTISTVGLGEDVNQQFLERVAEYAHGNSYMLQDPSSLAQILLRDVMEHTGSTAVEKPVVPVVLHDAEILKDVTAESAPALLGYVRFEAKPTAETILQVDEQDPLLARWQYGLGRAAVFTSDAKSRWAADWVGWEGFDKFWTNLVRDLLPHGAPSEAVVTYKPSSGELVADYRLSAYVPEPAELPDVFVLGPEGFRQALHMEKLAAGTYRGRIEIGDVEGLFRIRPLEESPAFPEVGFYRQEEEMNEFGSDEALLRNIAEFTGGRFEPPTREVFNTNGRALPSTLALWPGLLALAVLLSLAEIIERKWRALLASIREKG